MADLLVEPREPARGEAERLMEVRQAERESEFLRGFDAAQRGLRQHADSIALKHRAVLALARLGASQQAKSCSGLSGLRRHKTRTSPSSRRVSSDE